MGAFPVYRLGLSDPALLRATVTRVLENADIEAPERELGGVTYWRISDEQHGDTPVGAYIAAEHDGASFLIQDQ